MLEPWTRDGRVRADVAKVAADVSGLVSDVFVHDNEKVSKVSVEDTIQPDFVFRYFAIKDEDGSVRAVQPFFIIDQDLLLGANSRLGGVIGFIRWLWPRFMKMRTLMVGCAAGEGHLDGAEQLHRASAEILAASITDLAREM